MSGLGDEFPRQQARCRQLLEDYKEIGPVGQFGHMMISEVLKRADQAAISGDVIAMLRSYEEMRGCK